jgi:hypothetical protein
VAWNPPAAFTNGAVLTAAQLNQLRDSLLETAVAKATTAGRFLVANGLNAVVERAVVADTANGTAATASASYVKIVAPTVTVATGDSAMVHWAVQTTSATAGAVGYCAIEIPTSSITADDDNAIVFEVSAANDVGRSGMSWHVTGLTPGNNTFNMMYKSGGGQTVTFSRRHLWVLPQ